jgi:hypothetical protein
MQGIEGKEGQGQERRQLATNIKRCKQSGVKGALTRRRGPRRRGKDDNTTMCGSKGAEKSKGRGRDNRNRT